MVWVKLKYQRYNEYKKEAILSEQNGTNWRKLHSTYLSSIISFIFIGSFRNIQFFINFIVIFSEPDDLRKVFNMQFSSFSLLIVCSFLLLSLMALMFGLYSFHCFDWYISLKSVKKRGTSVWLQSCTTYLITCNYSLFSLISVSGKRSKNFTDYCDDNYPVRSWVLFLMFQFFLFWMSSKLMWRSWGISFIFKKELYIH